MTTGFGVGLGFGVGFLTTGLGLGGVGLGRGFCTTGLGVGLGGVGRILGDRGGGEEASSKTWTTSGSSSQLGMKP